MSGTASPVLVSIIINNYNYGRYLGAAIESALGQTYARVEVVVVDDGSTDDSRVVIARHVGRVVPVYKANGGQASAFNAGVAASRGDILCFLDADDVFYPTKVVETVEFMLRAGGTTKDLFVTHEADFIDGDGRPLVAPPLRRHRGHAPNLYAYARRHRHVPFFSGPTSACAMTRALADQIFPLPGEGIKTSADDLVVRAAALLGEVHTLDRTLTHYRLHGANHWYGARGRSAPGGTRSGRPVPKSREFHDIEDAYLNARLMASGREPVISFFDSQFARDWLVYHRRRGDLAWLAVTVARRHPDVDALTFMAKTLLLALLLPPRAPRVARVVGAVGRALRGIGR